MFYYEKESRTCDRGQTVHPVSMVRPLDLQRDRVGTMHRGISCKIVEQMSKSTGAVFVLKFEKGQTAGAEESKVKYL